LFLRKLSEGCQTNPWQTSKCVIRTSRLAVLLTSAQRQDVNPDLPIHNIIGLIDQDHRPLSTLLVLFQWRTTTQTTPDSFRMCKAVITTSETTAKERGRLWENVHCVAHHYRLEFYAPASNSMQQSPGSTDSILTTAVVRRRDAAAVLRVSWCPGAALPQLTLLAGNKSCAQTCPDTSQLAPACAAGLRLCGLIGGVSGMPSAGKMSRGPKGAICVERRRGGRPVAVRGSACL
jgi:hypothetical protein